MNLSAGIPKNKAHNCAESLKVRTEFVRINFPEALNCDPYRSPKLVDAIRTGMQIHGFYNTSKYSSTFANDETIIRYILKAQNKPMPSKIKKPAKQIVYGF